LDRQPADILKRRNDELANRGHRSPAVVAGERLLERLQAEENRRERLAGLVVQLTRQALALQLLGGDDAADDVAADALRKVNGNGSARGERLGETKVVVGERERV